jgi:crossover junction endodeoxyribonuclease RuvC
MKIIAIDPGYDRVGVAVLDGTPQTANLLFSTCIITKRTDSFPDRLLAIGTAFTTLLETYSPEAIALEKLFFNKNVTTAIDVAQARGTLIYLATQFGCTVHEFSPQTVKVATTGYGNSDKTAVTAMIKRLVANTPKNALDDEYDAIAVGVTCLAHHGQAR